MNKKKILLGLALATVFNAGNYAFASDNPFASVPQSTGYYEDVATLVHDGLIDGYVDTDFNASRPLTRVEMAIFTAKAMSNTGKASAEDAATIGKLQKEFQDELVDMHVKVPGVAASKAAAPAAAPAKQALQLGGEVRVRWDHYAKSVGGKGSTNTSSDKDLSYWLELDGKADLGNQWNAVFRIGGAKDLNGQPRGGQENTNGQFDILRAYAAGPLGPGTILVGRDKSLMPFDLVMGEYWQGVKYSADIKKTHIDVSYGKPDYLSSTRDTMDGSINYYNSKDDSYSWKDDRGVNDTKINPANTGINFFSIDATYPINDKWMIGGAYWHTKATNAKYQDANIIELMSKYQINKDLQAKVEYSKSNYDTQSKAYTAGLTYGNADKCKKGSQSVELDFVHLEAASYIKSTYDIKDNSNGAEGWQLIYKYVPTKNVVWMSRFLHSNTLYGASSKKTTTNWFRTQIEFFF